MANKCKYQKLQYQVSYDAGSTWENVTPIQVKKGDLIESESTDCEEIETLYRWVDLEGTYICDGNNKYTRQIQEESYNNGVSWYASYPTVYQEGTFVGVDGDYCCDKFIGHYIDTSSFCPKWYMWNGYKCVYVDPIKVVRCNDNPTLTSGETIYYNTKYNLIYCEIGDTVTSIGDGAFSGQILLSACTIPSGVTSIGNNAFSHCSGLTSITIPDSVTSIGQEAFRNCSGLTSCTIGSGVTSIGRYAFYRCTSLTSITIPDSVTSIQQYAFSGCTSLTSITCLATTPPSLEYTRTPTGGGFYKIEYNEFDNTNNCPIYVPCESIEAYRQASGWSHYNTRIVGLPPCEVNLEFYALYSDNTSYSAACVSSTLSSGITKAHTTSYTAMTSAEIGDCVTSIDTATFQGCSGLTSISMPNTVTNIGGYAFNVCSSLTGITIPSGVTTIGEHAFTSCSSLNSITIPSGVTSIGSSAFRGCSNLMSITVLAVTPPDIGEDAFSITNDCPIYVPCESVNVYKSTFRWRNYAWRIYGLPPC